MELDELITSYKEINKACGFNSVIEKNLWRYNLEDPVDKPREIESVCLSDAKVTKNTPHISKNILKKEPKNIPKYQNNLEEELDGILPSRLLRYDYRIKTAEAPEGHRYCNGYCQIYQPISQFKSRSASLLTICHFCEAMVDTAKIRLSNGSITKQQIRNDPTILKLGENEQICRKCQQILDKTEFPPKKRQCKKCRNSVRSKLGAKFDYVIEEEINTLKSLHVFEREQKIQTYVKTELNKIATFVGVGRKYNDKKQDMVNKLLIHFNNLI